MRYTLVHHGVPLGFAELDTGELAAGPLAPLSTIGSIRDTVRSGSQALLALGFFGAGTEAGRNGVGEALRAAAALEFELLDETGKLIPATFVNLIEAPDGGLVVIARFGHAHSGVPATAMPKVQSAEDEDRPLDNRVV